MNVNVITCHLRTNYNWAIYYAGGTPLKLALGNLKETSGCCFLHLTAITQLNREPEHCHLHTQEKDNYYHHVKLVIR